MSDERGFTLIELLVVILVIGVLAAIALPTFIGQRDRAQDANTKTDLRNAVTQMEACFTETEDYAGCPSSDYPMVGVGATTLDDGARYKLSQLSATGTTFTIERRTVGYTRHCTRPGKGGCSALSGW